MCGLRWKRPRSETRDASIRGMSVLNLAEADRARIHAGIGAMLRRGELRPQVAQVLPLAEAPRAHEAVMAPGHRGNVVMKP